MHHLFSGSLETVKFQYSSFRLGPPYYSKLYLYKLINFTADLWRTLLLRTYKIS